MRLYVARRERGSIYFEANFRFTDRGYVKIPAPPDPDGDTYLWRVLKHREMLLGALNVDGVTAIEVSRWRLTVHYLHLPFDAKEVEHDVIILLHQHLGEFEVVDATIGEAVEFPNPVIRIGPQSIENLMMAGDRLPEVLLEVINKLVPNIAFAIVDDDDVTENRLRQDAELKGDSSRLEEFIASRIPAPGEDPVLDENMAEHNRLWQRQRQPSRFRDRAADAELDLPSADETSVPLGDEDETGIGSAANFNAVGIGSDPDYPPLGRPPSTDPD